MWLLDDPLKEDLLNAEMELRSDSNIEATFWPVCSDRVREMQGALRKLLDKHGSLQLNNRKLIIVIEQTPETNARQYRLGGLKDAFVAFWAKYKDEQDHVFVLRDRWNPHFSIPMENQSTGSRTPILTIEPNCNVCWTPGCDVLLGRFKLSKDEILRRAALARS